MEENETEWMCPKCKKKKKLEEGCKKHSPEENSLSSVKDKKEASKVGRNTVLYMNSYILLNELQKHLKHNLNQRPIPPKDSGAPSPPPPNNNQPSRLKSNTSKSFLKDSLK